MPRESPKDLEQLRDVIRLVFWIITGSRERANSEADTCRAPASLRHARGTLATCTARPCPLRPREQLLCVRTALLSQVTKDLHILATKTTTIIEEPLLPCAFQTLCS